LTSAASAAAFFDKAGPALAVYRAGNRETERWFMEVDEMIHAWFPRIESCKIEGVGHLLHMQRADRVLSNVAAWLARHPISAAPVAAH
jgi:hypothetical protein